MTPNPDESESFERRMVEIRNALIARPDLCLETSVELAALKAMLDIDKPS
jgi:hypothetical protein